MLRIIFLLLLVLHALIHLMGFAKAFELAELKELVLPVSRSHGFWWLLAALVILFAALQYFFRSGWWWLPGIVGVVLSQLIIVSYWQDAKWGTVANIVILLVAVIGWGNWKFQRTVQSDLGTFWPATELAARQITSAKLAELPDPVGRWLRYSGLENRFPFHNAHLQQKGRMRTSSDGKWMDFSAEQWFTLSQPAFLWNAKVGGSSLMQLSGRDKLLNGRGHMLIKLFSLLPVVDAQGTEIDQGTLVRYLSEIIWFPTAALENHIEWEALDDHRARARLTAEDQTVEGIFYFNEKGQVIAFEADRYYQRKGESTLEVWHIDISEDSYRPFHNILVPTKADVHWKLEEGDFHWLELEVVALELR